MKINFKHSAFTLIIALTFGITGCGTQSKKPKTTDETVGSMSDAAKNMASELELNADSDSGKAAIIKSVYFEFNSASLTSNSRDVLSANAKFLKTIAAVEVQIEGHCDERGGVQYNLALGEKRAKTIKSYLIAMGVSSSRISTISFGKERPLAFGHDEGAWSQNRRGNFVITAK